jgi:hypothetical protein
MTNRTDSSGRERLVKDMTNPFKVLYNHPKHYIAPWLPCPDDVAATFKASLEGAVDEANYIGKKNLRPWSAREVDAYKDSVSDLIYLLSHVVTRASGEHEWVHPNTDVARCLRVNDPFGRIREYVEGRVWDRPIVKLTENQAARLGRQKQLSGVELGEEEPVTRS